MKNFLNRRTKKEHITVTDGSGTYGNVGDAQFAVCRAIFVKPVVAPSSRVARRVYGRPGATRLDRSSDALSAKTNIARADGDKRPYRTAPCHTAADSSARQTDVVDYPAFIRSVCLLKHTRGPRTNRLRPWRRRSTVPPRRRNLPRGRRGIKEKCAFSPPHLPPGQQGLACPPLQIVFQFTLGLI